MLVDRQTNLQYGSDVNAQRCASLRVSRCILRHVSANQMYQYHRVQPQWRGKAKLVCKISTGCDMSPGVLLTIGMLVKKHVRS
jgi:hypothetical protein